MKAFNAEEREINKFAQLNDTLYNSAMEITIFYQV